VLEVFMEVLVHMWRKKINFLPHKSKNKNKSDGKEKFDGKNKASQTTNFKEKTGYKKKGSCHVYGPRSPNRFDKCSYRNSGKSANIIVGDTEMKDVGYGIISYYPFSMSFT
jgi:hypothetical protein